MTKVKKPKIKVVKTKEEPVQKNIVNDEYAIIDYSSFSDQNFLKFIEDVWNNNYHDASNTTFQIKYTFTNLISEVRYHIKEKQTKTQELAKNYGSYDPNTDNWIIPPEVQQEFQNELNTLNDTRIQSESLKMNVSDLKKANIWTSHPFDHLSMALIEMLDDIINYDFFEEELTN